MAKETIKLVGGHLDGQTKQNEKDKNEFVEWVNMGDRQLPGEPPGEKFRICVWIRDRKLYEEGEMPVFAFDKCRFETRPK